MWNRLKKKVGISKGGSEMYSYKEQENKEWRPPEAFGVYAEEIENHFNALFPGRKGFVYHELASDLVHIDVQILRPTEEKPFYVMFTTGMSDLPMTIPKTVERHKELERAELFMFLPGCWNPGEELQIANDLPYEQYWPIQMIKYLARFPHEYKTWLGWGHTIPNGPNYEPLLEGSGMGGTVILEGDKISPLTAKDGTIIHMYMAMPAYREEIEYKLEHGMSALNAVFAERDLPLIIDMFRDNFCL